VSSRRLTESGPFPRPRELNGFWPNVVAKSPDGSLIIGEAKSRLGRSTAAFITTLRRLLDWANSAEPGALLAIAVPLGAGRDAERAAQSAGRPNDRVNVIEVDLER
jgi:hypothetical protein